MANKINIDDIATRLALKSGKQKKECEKFLNALIDSMSDDLSNGEEIDLSELGIFRLVKVESRKSIDVSTGREIEIPAHQKVVFVPSKGLSNQVNSPFEAFETVELFDEEISTESEETDTGDKELENGEEDLLSSERMDWESDEEDLDDMATSEAYLYNIDNDIEEDSKKYIENSERRSEDYINNNSVSEENLSEEIPNPIEIENNSSSRFAGGFFWGALCMLLVCGTIFLIGFYNGWYGNGWKNSESLTEITPNENEMELLGTGTDDSVNSEDSLTHREDENVKEPEIVYDTVSQTRYLTYIAREHYGNYNLWPYIYEENKAILGNPDRIKPGTQVVVPDLKKYGVDPKNPADIEKAKKMGAEIYSRYR